MPCVGEEPITSFFRRVTPGSKRKESTGSVLSAAKRKRPTTDAEANLRKPQKQQRLVLHNTPQAVNGGTPVERKTFRTDSYFSIPRGSSSTPPPVGDLFHPRVGSTGAGHIVQHPISSKSEEQSEPLFVASVRCSVTSRVQAARASQLPTPVTIRRPRRLPAQITLKTPPPTNYLKQKRRSQISQHAITFIPHTSTSTVQDMNKPSSSLHGEERVSDLLSPSSVADDSCMVKSSQVPVPQYLLKEASTRYDIREPIISNVPEVSRACSEGPFFVRPFSQDPVPSSQTQDNDISESSLTSFPLRTPPLPDRIASEMSGAPWNPYSATNPGPTDDCQCIHSSQTQHMLPYHISPRRSYAAKSSRHRTLSLHNLSDECTDEVIQSSQSQIERELDTSKEISVYFPRTIDSTINAATQLDDKVDDKESPTCFKQSEGLSHTDLLPRLGNLSQAAPVARALSDDLFSSSIRHLNFEDLFLKEISQNNADDTDLLSGQQHSYESATEDEFEEESEDVFSRTRNNGRPPDLVQPRIPIISHTPLTCAEDVNDEDLVDAPALQGSLSSTLKDFRDMFGEGDGSYPDDFPMSLR